MFDNEEFSKLNGIKDTITNRKKEYPKDFYQILECLDLVMRVYNGEKMGTTGVSELAKLISILFTDTNLLNCMPKDAHIFFRCLVNPQNAHSICDYQNLGYGYIHRAYSELRTYLIDNKERICEVWDKYYNFLSQLSDDMDKKYSDSEKAK